MLLDEALVGFRDEQGAVVFKDLCIHRGTPLSLGTLIDGRLRCAYHGWEYDRTGACVRIPAIPDGSPIPRRARVITYHVAEQYGLVWVALDDPVAPIPAWVEGEFGAPEYRTVLGWRGRWKSSAGRAVENFMDASHFPFVHTNLLGTLDRTLVEPHEVHRTEFGLRYDLHHEEVESGEFDLPGLLLREYHVYFPFTVHLRRIAPDGNITTFTFIASPTSRKETEWFLFVSRNHSFDVPDREFIEFGDMIMEQDRQIVENQRPEEIPLDLREELHIKVPDAAAVLYRRFLAEVGEFLP
jgi:phenylpropionate dioxygenase-like ring-hydroxylating dioxygenase large terminal subunit